MAKSAKKTKKNLKKEQLKKEILMKLAKAKKDL